MINVNVKTIYKNKEVGEWWKGAMGPEQVTGSRE
jgi:hypothetical protein